MAFNASLYAQLRPDLLTNWAHAADPLWANDPNVPGIRANGTIENYLQSDYAGDAAGNDARLSQLYGQMRPDLLNNWSHVNDPAYANDPNLPAIAGFGSLDNYLASQYSNYSGYNLAPYAPLSPVSPLGSPISSSGISNGSSSSGGGDFGGDASPFSNGGLVINGVNSDFNSPTFGGVLIPFDDGSNGSSSNGTYGSTGENTYVPGGSNNSDYYASPTTVPPGTIPINTDPNVVGSTPGTGNNGLPTNIPISPDGLDLGNTGGYPTSGGGIFSGNINAGTIIPLPVDPLTALGATILLSNGNVLSGGGGGSLSNVGTQIGNIATNPIGSVSSSLENLASGITGPLGQGAGATAGAIAFPTGSGGSSSSGPNQSSGGNTTVLPIDTGNTSSPTTETDSGHGTSGPIFVEPAEPTPAAPIIAPTPTDSGHGTTGPIYGEPAEPAPAVENPINTTVVPLPTTPTPPTTTDQPTNPTTVVPLPTSPTTPTTPTTPTQVTPVVPLPTTTMPDTTIASPLDRNYYNETNQTSNDLQSLLAGWLGNYANASGTAGQTDFTNFQNILNQYGDPNSTLTDLANQQTAASNTALRQSNLNDVGNLSQQALGIQQSVNPNLYSGLNAGQQGADQFLQLAQQQQNDANFLSPQERNTAQQAARDAWSARGLVNSPGAVGDEILNTDALLRARQQQAFTNTATALNSYGQNTALQSANQFNPFSTILGSQYGQQTQNTGTNNSLYGQTGGISSGALGNQYAQNVTNPNSAYQQDIYSGNFNASNARNIAAGNNAAAIQGANTANNAAIANGFLRFAGQYLSGTCWVARSVFGTDNPKWLVFRHWLVNYAPKWFLKLYMKHGEKFATWLDKHPSLKPMIRRWMESRIRSIGMNGKNLTDSATDFLAKGGC